jgi:hypothetical protein
MDYVALNPWARDVKADYFTGNRQDIGKARLDSIQPKDMGIFSTILYLLAIRRNMLKPRVPVDKIPPAEDFIKSIFFNPQSYIKGQKPLPSKNVAIIYNDTSCEMLLKIAQAAYELFEQQKISILALQGEEKLPNEEAAYAAFMGDGVSAPAKPMRWLEYKPDAPAATSEETSSPFTAKKESYSSERRFDTNFRELLEELFDAYGREIGVVEPSKPLVDRYGREIKADEPRPDEEKKEQKKLRPFEVTQSDENEWFKYSLDLLKKHEQEVPQAGNLYSLLMGLADYVQKEGQFDWDKLLSNVSKVATGLRMGMPQVGR